MIDKLLEAGANVNFGAVPRVRIHNFRSTVLEKGRVFLYVGLPQCVQLSAWSSKSLLPYHGLVMESHKTLDDIPNLPSV